MKAWTDLPPPRRGHVPWPEQQGHGHVRLGLTVVVPEMALRGDEGFEFTVFTDPDTGDWHGEEPAYPGSALVALDREHVFPSTTEDVLVADGPASLAPDLLR